MKIHGEAQVAEATIQKTDRSTIDLTANDAVNEFKQIGGPVEQLGGEGGTFRGYGNTGQNKYTPPSSIDKYDGPLVSPTGINKDTGTYNKPISAPKPDGTKDVFTDTGEFDGPFIHPEPPDVGSEGGGNGGAPDVPVVPPTDGADLEPPSAGDQMSARAQIEKMLKDPTSYLTDRDLLQQFTNVDIFKRDESGNIVRDDDGNPILDDTQFTDPNKFNLGQIGDLDATTINIPDPIKASADVKASDYTASLVDPESLTKAVDELAKVEPMKAASMAEHMDKLLEGMEDGNIPLWAKPAVAKVEQQLAARGISASSIGRDSLFNAIIQSAMPIAQQDATFEQEKYKTEYNAKVQAVLSDVNMEFAAKQFNAQSQNQAKQFSAQMKTQVDLQNAARKDAMLQFNTQVQMQGEQFNATQVNAMTQLEAQLQTQRDQFNSQMSAQIEQSNVNWRRQVNQINTAGVNAVNQANVQNAFNLSNQALTFLWQEMRDNAQWEFQASQADLDRKAQIEASLLANETALGGEIGKTIESIVNGSKFLGSFLDSWK